MSKMLIIVHSSSDANFLSAYFNKHVPNLNLTLLPIPEKGRCFETNAREVFSYDLPDKTDVIIVESNYGKPADPLANKILLQGLLEQFPEATIVAHGSTMASLTDALNIHPRLMIMGKGNINPKECDASRIHSLTTLKNLLNTNPTSSSSLTFAYDLSIALSECHLKNNLPEATQLSYSTHRPL